LIEGNKKKITIIRYYEENLLSLYFTVFPEGLLYNKETVGLNQHSFSHCDGNNPSIVA
jgi:hypothetical protein